MTTPNLSRLKEAVTIAEQIERLQRELTDILGDKASASLAKAMSAASPGRKNSRRTMSPAARAKISKAAKARWAGVRETSSASTNGAAPAGKKKRKLSAEGRANIVAAQKARWAAKKTAAAAAGKK